MMYWLNKIKIEGQSATLSSFKLMKPKFKKENPSKTLKTSSPQEEAGFKLPAPPPQLCVCFLTSNKSLSVAAVSWLLALSLLLVAASSSAARKNESPITVMESDNDISSG